jgi:hypothetical protein
MFRPALRLSLVLLLGLAMPGCKLLPWGRKPKKEATAKEMRVGRVELVNEDGHFVLVETSLTQPPAEGTTLRAYTGGIVSAELKVTGVRRKPFLVADLVSGTPTKGDVVVQDTPKPTPPPTPAPGEPTPAPKKPLWKRLLFFGRH